MSKPRRKLVIVRLPREVDAVLRLVAKRSGTSMTDVVNVLLAVAFVHLKENAPDRVPVRGAKAR